MKPLKDTYSYSLKFPEIKYKTLGKTGLTASVCGFGCYRIDKGTQQHRLALEFSLTNGINLIDTSANYTDGGSENLIGQVLENLFTSGSITREEIIVITKGGYIQGENLKTAREKEKSGNPYSEVVVCSPDLWHSIHPRFLNDQISKSLINLKLKKIDVYLLHNPEYFLSYSLLPVKEREAEYYSRIKKAFKHLEDEVEKGRISWYGVSSNTFGSSTDDIAFTSLERLLETAYEVSPHNHFAVIQLPLNLLEPEAAINKNQHGNSKTVLQLAAENNIGVLVNRPLNAIVNNKLVRLSDFVIKEDRTREEISELIDQLGTHEKILKEQYVNKAGFSQSEVKSLYDCLSLSDILKNNYEKFETPNHFQEIKGYYLIPRANYAVQQLLARIPDDINLITELKKYAVITNILLDSVESDLSVKQNIENKKLHDSLSEYFGNHLTGLPLSQKALLMINSLPQVTSTLVGMKRTEYVKDVLNSIKQGSISKAEYYWDKPFTIK